MSGRITNSFQSSLKRTSRDNKFFCFARRILQATMQSTGSPTIPKTRLRRSQQ
jgi:hypothetical protein